MVVPEIEYLLTTDRSNLDWCDKRRLASPTTLVRTFPDPVRAALYRAHRCMGSSCLDRSSGGLVRGCGREEALIGLAEADSTLCFGAQERDGLRFLF